MNLIILLKNITAHLSRLNATASIHSLTQQLKKLFGILNTNTGKLTTTTQKNSCKLRKFRTYRRQPLLAQLLLILSSFVLIVITSCAPSSDTAAPPDNPTLLANLIKESNSGLNVTADNSDPANPKLTITGITNNSNATPVTATITIDQTKGITTDPASFTVTAESPISPYSTDTALTVTFEGEAAVSYTVTTQISGAAVGDWIVTENLSEYITVSFGGQSGNLSVTDTTLSIEGLTNSPGADAGTITFGNLPAGFTAEPSSFTLPNPDGTESAMITAEPNTFTITEEGNTGNSETYTIGMIDLAKLTRFTPSIHIKVAEGGTDITSDLMITEEANNMIRIIGLTNKLGANQYTLTIDEVPDFFTIPGVTTQIGRTIFEPTVDFLPGPASSITLFRTIQVLNSGESTATTYTLIVEFSAAAPSDWFTAASLSTYITAASFGAESGTLTLDGTNLLLSGGNAFTNVPGGMVALTIGTLLDGYTLTGADGLTDPDGDGLAAVTDGDAGMITILETDKPANRQDYPVMITLGAYRSPLTAANIAATYGVDTAPSSNITIDTNMITISGFTNNAGTSESGTVTFPTITDYTITPSPLTIPDPEGESATTANLEITVTDTRDGGVAVPHPVTVNFFGLTELSVTSTDINSGNALTVPAGTTITITTAACELLATPTVTVVDNDNSKVAETTPFPLYYDRDRDPSVMTTSGTLTGYTVTRRLTLEDGNSNVIGTDFAVTMVFPACTNFAVGTGNDANSAYEIDNAPRLELAAHLVNNSNSITPTGTSSTNTYGASHYKITANINMGLPGLPFSEVGSGHPNEMGTNGKGFLPIGRGNARFSGTLDCDSKTISNLYINRPTEANVGLIGALGVQMGVPPMSVTLIPGTVQNCFLNDVKITGLTDVGGLVGRSQFGSMISNSYATGVVVGNSGNIGGLVGSNNSSTINDSYANVNTSSAFTAVGGLAGSNDFGTINRSYATGTVRGGTDLTGGLVGESTSGTINDSYATGAVSAQGGRIGGLAGYDESGTINRSYATGTVSGGGGLVGSSLGSTVSESYWDITIGPPVRATEYGTGRTTAQMQVDGPVTDAPGAGEVDNRVYENWNTSIWNFTDGQYPRLIDVVCANRQYNQDATDCTSTLR